MANYRMTNSPPVGAKVVMPNDLVPVSERRARQSTKRGMELRTATVQAKLALAKELDRQRTERSALSEAYDDAQREEWLYIIGVTDS